MIYGTGTPKRRQVPANRIRNCKKIMTQLLGLTVATHVEDYVLLNISALLATAFVC
jgi:hypothetical protein